MLCLKFNSLFDWNITSDHSELIAFLSHARAQSETCSRIRSATRVHVIFIRQDHISIHRLIKLTIVVLILIDNDLVSHHTHARLFLDPYLHHWLSSTHHRLNAWLISSVGVDLGSPVINLLLILGWCTLFDLFVFLFLLLVTFHL